MKRFQWPLQRVLDVTLQRERALRMDLFRLSQKIAGVHRKIFRRQAVLRETLGELAARNVGQRLPEQQVVMQCSPAERARLDRMRADLQDLQKLRSDTIDTFIKTRSSRRTLERLLEEASRQHTADMLREEQKQLDESSQVAFVRERLSRAGALESGA
jgi:flagellar biosynthesis chaperone FliJ